MGSFATGAVRQRSGVATPAGQRAPLAAPVGGRARSASSRMAVVWRCNAFPPPPRNGQHEAGDAGDGEPATSPTRGERSGPLRRASRRLRGYIDPVESGGGAMAELREMDIL